MATCFHDGKRLRFSATKDEVSAALAGARQAQADLQHMPSVEEIERMDMNASERDLLMALRDSTERAASGDPAECLRDVTAIQRPVTAKRKGARHGR
jgi:hypothetical protein